MSTEESKEVDARKVTQVDDLLTALSRGDTSDLKKKLQNLVDSFGDYTDPSLFTHNSQWSNISACGAVLNLLASSKPSAIKLCGLLVKALSLFACNPESKQWLLHNTDILSLGLVLLRRNDGDVFVIVSICELYEYLMYDADIDVKDKLIKIDLLSHIFRLIDRYCSNTAVLEHCFRLLHGLCIDTKAQSVLTQSGRLPSIIETLRIHCMHASAGQGEGQIPANASTQDSDTTTQPVASSTSNGSRGVVRSCLGVIRCMANNSGMDVDHIANAGGIAAILEAMGAFRHDPEIVEYSFAALGNCVRFKGAPLEIAKSLDAMSAIRAAMDVHRSDDTIQQFGVRLDRLLDM